MESIRSLSNDVPIVQQTLLLGWPCSPFYRPLSALYIMLCPTVVATSTPHRDFASSTQPSPMGGSRSLTTVPQTPKVSPAIPQALRVRDSRLDLS
jgi:hypothetical protein